MTTKIFRFGRTWTGVLTMALLTGICFALPGCLRGCDLPQIPITIPFGNNVTIPASDFQLPVDEVTINIPPGDAGGCEITGVDELLAMLDQASSGVLAGFVRVESITVDRIVLTASSGDFSWLESLSLRVIATNEDDTERIFELTTTAGATFSDEVVLAATTEIDIWALLNEGFDCIRAEATFSSNSLPDEDVIFDGELDLTLQTVAGGRG